MLIKPKAMPADPTKVCRTCSHHDPDLHVCCANDYAIRDEEANTVSCSDWNPKKICITCGHFDPDTNQCWFEEHDMSEEESLTRTCESWEPRKEKREKQLPPGACCFNCEHRDKMSLKCKLKRSDAVLAYERSQHEYCDSWEREQDHGVTMRVVDPEEDKKQREAQVQECLIAKEKGYRRGYMVAELHMMCDAASQLLPDRKPQWERLRSILEDALKAWWARNDQHPDQQEVSHE